jgi:hypothetical protein
MAEDTQEKRRGLRAGMAGGVAEMEGRVEVGEGRGDGMGGSSLLM